MIALLQRVSRAGVEIGGATAGAIDAGLLVFVAVQRGDGPAQADRLLERILSYRVFADGEGRMDRSLSETGGGLLLVSQFTLAADTRKGTRPSFTPAASPDVGAALYDHLVDRARARHSPVASGRFGADMQVSLVNDGPVTLLLSVAPDASPD